MEGSTEPLLELNTRDVGAVMAAVREDSRRAAKSREATVQFGKQLKKSSHSQIMVFNRAKLFHL